MFSIGFTEELFTDAQPGEKARIGLLRLGGYEERFIAHLNEWREQEYVEHWARALARALAAKPAALVTDMWTPAHSTHLVWWPLWKVGDDLVFHNQLFFFATHSITGDRIDVEELFVFLGKHFSRNEEGNPVSEWRVPVTQVETFLTSSSAQLD
jgi:ABC-type histidine transport system ATPase subunit